jgi:glycosyltransferase involved in cell wall biosynthesis
MAERALHVAIDGRELLGHPTGVGRYLHAVLERWAAARGSDAPEHRFTVVLPSEPDGALRGLGPRVAWHVAPGGSAGTWWEQVTLPRALAGIGPDVLFAPAYTAPLRARCPFVLLVHDVSFHAHPEWFGRREGMRRRWLTRASARRARKVLTVSEFSRRQAARYLGLAESSIAIASPAVDPQTLPTPATRSPLVLYAGSLLNRRNVPLMLEAFARVVAEIPDARLVLAGDNRTHPRQDPTELARRMGVADHVEWRHYVSDRELADLYASARVFLFLSAYEGFGMTPLEALARGVAPVVLDTDVSREVYADAAVRVPPDAAQIAATVVGLLRDDTAREVLLAAGRRRLAHYSWDRTAQVIRHALEDAAR